MNIKKTVALGCLCSVMLFTCGDNESEAAKLFNKDTPTSTPEVSESFDTDSIAKEAEVLSVAPAAIDLYLDIDAPGTLEERSDRAVIDYSNTDKGYVMVQYTENTDRKLKTQLEGPETTYIYTIDPGEWNAFPLSDGNGQYRVTVFENVEGKKYALVLTTECSVELEDEFAPFIRPNQYVNYMDAPNTRALAAELCAGSEDATEEVKRVYEYVIENISYDDELAENVQSGYLPDLDYVLENKTGICFDYASLMTGMLRSQGVPCKLVVGYAGDAYHAWISVWVDGTGWVDNIVYFDGNSWQRMDPTFASAGASDFVGNGDNYLAKYFY
jgi:Transglutaminase-like enzymes, putative cysteine proteases